MERASIKDTAFVKAASIKEPISPKAALIKERTSVKNAPIQRATSVKAPARSSTMERASIKEPILPKAALIKERTSVKFAPIQRATSVKEQARPCTIERASIKEPTSVKARRRSSHRMSKKGIPGGGSPLTIGDRVVVGQFRQLGYVRFVGFTQFAEGEWVGIELDEPYGKNNGSVQGQHYFDCEPNYGLFCRGISVAKCEAYMNSTNARIQQQLGAPTLLPAETSSQPNVQDANSLVAKALKPSVVANPTLEGDAWLLQVGEELEQRIWEGLERRLEDMIQKAVASATRELMVEASELQPSKESNRDEHCVVEGALRKSSVIKCALQNAEIKLQPSKETDTDDNNSAIHCIIKSALHSASHEICATTRCMFDKENLMPLARQRIPPSIDTPYAGIAMQGEQKTMGITEIRITEIIQQLKFAGLNTQQSPAKFTSARKILELVGAEDNGQLRTRTTTIATE